MCHFVRLFKLNLQLKFHTGAQAASRLGLLAQKGNCEEESSPKAVGKTDREYKKVTCGKKIFLMPFI